MSQSQKFENRIMGAGGMVGTNGLIRLRADKRLPDINRSLRNLGSRAEPDSPSPLLTQFREYFSKDTLAKAVDELVDAYWNESANPTELNKLAGPFAKSLGMHTSPAKPAAPNLFGDAAKGGPSGRRPGR